MSSSDFKSIAILFLLTLGTNFNVSSHSSGHSTMLEDDGPMPVLIEEGSSIGPTTFEIPTASINDVTVTEGEDAVFTFSLDIPPTSAVSISYGTSGVTADDPEDYTGVGSENVMFNPGEQIMMIAIGTVDDDESGEGDETFQVSMFSATNASFGVRTTGIATIQDNDSPPGPCPQPYPDFNMDNDVDAADLVGLIRGIQGGDPAFDLTGDNMTDDEDLIKFTLSWFAADCGVAVCR